MQLAVVESGQIGLDRFGLSAPGERLFQEFGFTIEGVMAAVRRVVAGIRS